MRHFDLSPLYRSTVGFDRFAKIFDSLMPQDEKSSYPPYNIERLNENAYRISMAVAGFSRDDIDIRLCHNQITIKGEKKEFEDDAKKEFLHRGIASRSFERKFQLADYMEVTEANLENGLLYIDFKREIPEEMHSRKIELKCPDKTQKTKQEILSGKK